MPYFIATAKDREIKSSLDRHHVLIQYLTVELVVVCNGLSLCSVVLPQFGRYSSWYFYQYQKRGGLISRLK